MGHVTNAVQGRAQLSRLTAEAMAAQIKAMHPRADALVLYCFGTGGYGVVARSPLPGQEDVVLLSREAYQIFLQLRADAWQRAWDGKGSAETMTEREQESAIATLQAAREQEGR